MVLKTIQLMRGFAAVAVVALHVDVILTQERYGSNKAFNEFGSMGWLGVNFFFILSGFIILNTHYKDIGEPEKVRYYLYRRITRLYPIYWIVLSSFIIASSFLHFDKVWKLGDFIVGYTLLPFSEYPNLPIQVAWTLLFEIKFYLIFGLLIFSKRIGFAVMIAWVIALFFANSINTVSKWNAFGVIDIINVWNINFVFGMLVFWVVKNIKRSFGWPIMCAGLAMLSYLTSLSTSMPDGLLSFSFMISTAIAFSSIIAGAVLIEKRNVDFKIPKCFLMLGNASYSIYLTHSAFISAAVIFFKEFSVGKGAEIAAMTFFFAILCGVATHHCLELPLLRLIRKDSEKKTVLASNNFDSHDIGNLKTHE